MRYQRLHVASEGVVSLKSGRAHGGTGGPHLLENVGVAMTLRAPTATRLSAQSLPPHQEVYEGSGGRVHAGVVVGGYEVEQQAACDGQA